MEEARASGQPDHQRAFRRIGKIFCEHKETSLRQAELTLKTETNRAKQDLNKALAKSQLDLKRKQGKCQTQLKNKLFKEVLELTENYMKTAAYR